MFRRFKTSTLFCLPNKDWCVLVENLTNFDRIKIGSRQTRIYNLKITLYLVLSYTLLQEKKEPNYLSNL